MSHRSFSPLYVLFALLLLVLLGPLAAALPSPAQAAVDRSGEHAARRAGAAKQACSADRLDALRAELDQARAAWVTNLEPNAYAAYAEARAAYVKEIERCAKKLNLDPNDALKGVRGYDAPVKSGGRAPAVATASGILFDGSPGTAAPPATLGAYPMTAFPGDPRAEYALVDGVNSPLGGGVEFDSSVTHFVVGSGWSTWSHGYTGSVYFNSDQELTIYLPEHTRAFYFYVQPNQNDTDDVEAVANDGTSSYPIPVTSPDGAKYFGFYAPLGGEISYIDVSCPDCAIGFAVGEFGINQNRGADLRLTKFSEPHNVVQAGDTFTYTIYVDNLGPDIANNVVITDTLLSSSNVSIQSCAFSVSQGGGAITQFTCTPGNLVSTQFGTDVGTFSTNFLDPLSPRSQGRLRASFRLVAEEAIDVANTTRVSSDTYDPNLDNNFAVDTITVTPVSDLAIVKTAPASAGAGETITYTMTITNTGPSPAANVMVLDYLAAGVTGLSYTPAQGSCNAGVPGDPLLPVMCSLGTLDAGGAVIIEIVVKVNPDVFGDTLLFNDVQVSSDTPDENKDDNIDTVATSVVGTCAVAPSKPLLVSPPNAAVLGPKSVLLDWTDSNCALTYRVNVRDGAPNGPIVEKKRNLHESQYVTGDLTRGVTYYWRARACNGIACRRSAVGNFTIKP